MRGMHLMKHWCTTQATVALSSAEAELISLVKGAAEGIGLTNLLGDLGSASKVTLSTDATAAIGVCRRSGVGRIRHLGVRLLWIQDKVRHGEVFLQKVPGADNPADLFTKFLGADVASAALARLQCWPMTGRAHSAPELDMFGSERP